MRSNLSYLYQQSILSPEWISRSREIKKRDDYICQQCGQANNVLQVHHKYYVTGRQAWEYPDNALITLCLICHQNSHNDNEIEYFKEGDDQILKYENPKLYQKIKASYKETYNPPLQYSQPSEERGLLKILLMPFELLFRLLLSFGFYSALFIIIAIIPVYFSFYIFQLILTELGLPSAWAIFISLLVSPTILLKIRPAKFLKEMENPFWF